MAPSLRETSMLETLDLSLDLDSNQYRERKGILQVELYRVQQAAREVGLGTILVFEGWNYSGKSRCLRYLTDPLDPRWFKLHVMYPPTKEDSQYPFARRYLLRMPARGQIYLFLRSWYYHVLDERVHGRKGDPLEATVALEEIRQLERGLAEDGFLILKFWLHLDKNEMNRRRRRSKLGTPAGFLSGLDDPKQHRYYDKYLRAAEEMLAVTSTDFARWYPIPAHSSRYARDAIAARVLNRMQDEIELRRRQKALSAELPATLPTVPLPILEKPMLSKVDLTTTIEEKDYNTRIKKARNQLLELQYASLTKKRGVIIVMEGWDAAGKGGSIRRLTRLLDPRYYEVHSIAAPRGEEADHHYLWRFWKTIPPIGHWSVFDRSWYGRVLVERIEGYASVPEWRRAYAEIRDFENTLFDSGYIIIKFWLQISKDEQLRRFQDRETDERKRYKITEEDYRNREKWDDYEKAIEDMFQRTSTTIAPWTLVSANDKRFARVQILEQAVQQIRKGLERKLSPLKHF